MPSQCLGVDWGTHSSKWCIQGPAGLKLVGRIWDSKVWRTGKTLRMYPLERRYSGECGEGALKRKLILDPDQPFWVGERRKLGIPLGEAVVFTLLGLLLDSKRTLAARGSQLVGTDGLSVRFSHPNWVGSDAIAALQCFRDAAVVALLGFGEITHPHFPDDCFELPVLELQSLVARHRPQSLALQSLPSTYDYDLYKKCLSGSEKGIDWQFVFESCAAGLPYLIQDEPETFDLDEFEYSQHKWVRKILVVDIGAGSTDSGYMLRTIELDSRGKPTSPLLIWLPAAPAFERAGNWLTERIREDWVKEGRPAVTLDEAEIHKTSGAEDWHTRPYVEEWSLSIARRVRDYIEGVPDEIRLPKTPPLEVVITGGSSAVPRAGIDIVTCVVRGLKARGIAAQLADNTRSMSASIKGLQGGGFSDIQLAQLAVSLGASDPRLTRLTHYPKGLVRGRLEKGARRTPSVIR